MALLEEERIKIEGKAQEGRLAILKMQVDLGRSAERLSVNQDWVKVRNDTRARLESLTLDKTLQYDSIMNGAETQEQKLKAVETIRLLNSQIILIENFLRLPDDRAQEGRDAETELKAIEKSQEEKK